MILEAQKLNGVTKERVLTKEKNDGLGTLSNNTEKKNEQNTFFYFVI